MAVRLVGGAADQRVLGLEAQVERAQHPHGLGDDLGADAVARQDCDLHESARCVVSGSGRGASHGLLQQPLGLEGADLVGVAQRQADVVEAAEQAVLAERLDLEGELAAVGLDDDLALEVDRQRVADEGRDLVEQRARPGARAARSAAGRS